MSFILDALKKSEAERNRKTGPVLLDMRIARPRRQLPVWVWIIAGVLLANLALLGYVLVRGTPLPETIAAADEPRATPGTAAVAPVTVVDPATAPALPPPALPASPPPAAGGVIMQSNAVVSPNNSPAVERTGATGPPPTQATMAADTGLPTAEELRQGGVPVPDLRLSLHVYDAIPANRFVLLNSSRLREGQETAEGVLVERIDETGLVLSWRGRRFRMHPGN